MSSEEIYKPNDYYRIKNHKILKDGHTMLAQNIENDLNNYRRGYLKLQAESKRLRAALEVYADEGNWLSSDMDEFEFACGYTIAQEALKGE